MIGVLEVLLVKARGIRRRNLIGGSTYYATIECGDRVYKSKASSEGEDYRVWWNQKFSFEFPLSNQTNSWSHLKIKIMDLTVLREDGFIGGTTIFVGGVVEEGVDRGYVEVKPTPYNVVLEDDTYKGEMVVGIKFTLRKERRMEENIIGLEEENATSGSINSSFWWYVRKIASHWWKFFSRVCLERNKEKES